MTMLGHVAANVFNAVDAWVSLQDVALVELFGVYRKYIRMRFEAVIRQAR